MRVARVQAEGSRDIAFELRDDADQPIEVVGSFLRYLQAQNCSPNTVAAYAYDLLHFWRFLTAQDLTYQEFTPARSLTLLEYLRTVPSRQAAHRLSPVLCTTENGHSATRLAPTTINRIIAAISSFYEYLIVADLLPQAENPIQQRPDSALARVPERHQPFMGYASRQRPIRRIIRVKTVERLPRPLTDQQVEQLLGSFQRLRDKALFLLMLHGGLRPGEALTLQLEDIQYGRRRVMIRYRTDHPQGVRTKSRTERVVDLHDPLTLPTLSAYVMQERPTDTDSPWVFLVGGHGTHHQEPLSYQAFVKLFARHCEHLGIRAPWITPHALRHTHATQMWEAGMRELTLQKRLGHRSPESTRLYTRVSDPQVVADYCRALGEDPDK